MSNNSEHCCLSCGVDISNKRIDAKYCSGRCRMRYCRSRKKDQLIEELVELFRQLPNHSVQFTDKGFYLEEWDVINRTTQKWYLSELKSMSNQQLNGLIEGKKWRLAGENLANLLFNRS
ncbi:hypothetical protein NC796_00045 [Aliifodinibius sp. S!AR15-10]|uniref:hypothetical protein n=1 Tax=Aliifodinibius sp. S!AR15-10 TaxID=2950437 RepID=UPI002866D204|nr:hypothetical protein [Aliifodinibius sp. S!AR15-10]MDR8389503.1 hypothetical protein [Aliifodinibius sp. S!AR15-10]